jgi:hypothetical protein
VERSQRLRDNKENSRFARHFQVPPPGGPREKQKANDIAKKEHLIGLMQQTFIKPVNFLLKKQGYS